MSAHETVVTHPRAGKRAAIRRKMRASISTNVVLTREQVAQMTYADLGEALGFDSSVHGDEDSKETSETLDAAAQAEKKEDEEEARKLA